MKIVLTNGTELNPILVTGAKRDVQGAMRDTLSFVFPASQSMEDLDALFSATNCEKITIVEDEETSHIHNGYTVRAELKKATVVTSPATVETAAVTEERITVSMSQRTYVESQMASLIDTVDVLVLESLMG